MKLGPDEIWVLGEATLQHLHDRLVRMPAGKDQTVLLKHQSIQTATARFSWRSSTSPSAASTGLSEPQQQGLSDISELPRPDGGQGAGKLFMEKFCREVQVGSVGVAFSYDRKAVYVGRVTKREVLPPKKFDEEIDSGSGNPTFLNRRQTETFDFFSQWLDEFRRLHGWDGLVLELQR